MDKDIVMDIGIDMTWNGHGHGMDMDMEWTWTWTWNEHGHGMNMGMEWTQIFKDLQAFLLISANYSAKTSENKPMTIPRKTIRYEH
jgi:hypothetical protein